MLSVEPEGSPWADLAWSAMEELQADRDVEIKRVAGISSSAVEQQVRAMARDGYDPVVVMQDELGAAAIELASSFPDTNFIVVDSHITSDEPNVETIVIDPTGAAYIAGVVAANTTETGSIGFVGGMDVPNIQKYLCGLETGIAAVDSSITVEAAYAGTFVDPTKGRETAVALLEGGNDIVMHAAALSGLGVISAAKELGKKAIGADVWQGGEAPEAVQWSALKDGKGAVVHAVTAAVDGDFEAGQLVWGPANGAALYDERDFDAVDADIQEQVTAAAEGLESGDITLACD
jgi:basic membrane protein A